MAIHSDPLIKKKQAISYIDGTLMQLQNKNEMFTVINEYNTLPGKVGVSPAPDKIFFFLNKIKFLGLILSLEGIQPVAKRAKDFKNLRSPENKRDVMNFFGCFGFYSCNIENFHVDNHFFKI